MRTPKINGAVDQNHFKFDFVNLFMAFSALLERGFLFDGYGDRSFLINSRSAVTV